MTRRVQGQEAKRSFRVELSVGDAEVLDQASALFGIGKSELVRRLVWASVDAGPALSADGIERLETLTAQFRIVGRNLMQVLRAIHRGDAVGIAESEPVWRGLHELIAAIDGELSGLTASPGAPLRESAGLSVLAAIPNEAA